MASLDDEAPPPRPVLDAASLPLVWLRAQIDKAASAGAYPYPVVVVAGEAEAIAWAEARLAPECAR